MPVTRRKFLSDAISVGAAGLLPAGFAASCSRKASAGADVRPEEREAMAALSEQFRRQHNAPGISIAIARDGYMQYQQAFGTTEHDGSEPLRTSNLFRIASISKPITAVTIYKLVEQGRLSTDNRVFGEGGILGRVYGTPPYGPHIEEITIDHLLGHTGGGWGKHNDPMFSHLSLNQEELISWVLDHQPLEHAPGTVFEYSNFGFCVLGRVIEKVTEQPYETFVQETTLAPSGISDMHIAANMRSDRYPLEVIYFGQNGEDPYSLNVSRMDSHGGWIATPSDLVNFTLHVTGAGNGPALLKPETVRTMTTPIAADRGRARGWAVNNKGHWWHSGDLAGTSAILVRHAKGLCWAGLVNTRGDSTDVALDDFMWTLIAQVKAWKFALG